jgi:hypothetical protein
VKRITLLALCSCGRLGFDAHTRGDGGRLTDTIIDDAPALDAGLPAGLVAWYPFEGSRADVVAAHDGVCPAQQCPTNGVGHRGQALTFDGVDDCITVTDDGQLQLPNITLAIWARQTATGQLSHVAKRVIGGSVNSWQIETEAQGTPALSVSFTTYDNSGLNQYAKSAANVIVLGQWQHLAATYDGTTKRLYVDGIEVATMTQTVPLPYDNQAMKIGCDDNAPEAEFYAGTLDDLQIYNRPLSASEIAALAAR